MQVVLKLFNDKCSSSQKLCRNPNTNIQKGLLGNQPTLGQNKDPKEPPEPISGRKKPIGKKKLQEQVL